MRLIIEILAAALFAALMATIIIEWAVGCGQEYQDAAGQTHIGECVFIPSRK
jgi:nitrogen fixation-related uncharacterized protein